MSKKRRQPPMGDRRIALADNPAPSPSKVDRKLLEVRVIPAGDLLSSFVDFMPNPDEVLRNAGEALSVYREMRTDARVKSLLTVARSAVLNYPLRLEQGDATDAVMTEATRAFNALPLYGIAKRLLAGMDYGYSVVEIVWQSSGPDWMPADAVLRKPERFAFDAEGRLKLRDLGLGSRNLYDQDYKWLVYRHDKDAENPYGTSVLRSCYWPWKFKKAGLEFWLMATEKFAVPSILALFESQDGPERTRERAMELAGMLNQVSSGSGAAFANVKEAKVLQPEGRVSEFKALMDWCDTQIAYGIVFQSLAVQEAQNGTRAQAEVHEDTFRSATKGVCRDLAPVLQRVVDWFVELNFGPGEPAPTVAFDLADYATWQMICDALDHGVPLSMDSLYDRYGLPKPKDDKDGFLPPVATILPSLPGEGGPGATSAQDVQSTALNGAQVSSLVDLAAQVSAGNLPIDTARAIASASFPLVSREDIDAIFSPLVGFTPTGDANLADGPVKKKSARRPVAFR
jgi:hypothetical protein